MASQEEAAKVKAAEEQAAKEKAAEEQAVKKKELIQADEERAKAYEAFAARGDWTNPLPRSMRPGKQPPPVAL